MLVHAICLISVCQGQERTKVVRSMAAQTKSILWTGLAMGERWCYHLRTKETTGIYIIGCHLLTPHPVSQYRSSAAPTASCISSRLPQLSRDAEFEFIGQKKYTACSLGRIWLISQPAQMNRAIDVICSWLDNFNTISRTSNKHGVHSLQGFTVCRASSLGVLRASPISL